MTTYSTIDDLPPGTPAGTDSLEVSQGGVSRRVTINQVGAGAVLPFLPSAGGTLTGNLNGTTAAFSGEITAATAPLGDNDTTVATTAFVKGQNYAGAAGFLPIGGGTLTGPLAGTTAAFSGNVTMPTQAPGNNTTNGATTAFVGVATSALAPLASPTFTGDPKAPTPTAGDNDTSIATTAFVTAAVSVVSGGGPFLPTAGGTLSGPLTGTTANFSGLVTALTPTPAGDSSTKVATTAFVQGALPTALPPNGAAGGGLAGTYPNPTFAEMHMRLYAETVLASANVEMRVNVPAGAKAVELWFSTVNTGNANDTLLINALNGAAIQSGATYDTQYFYGSAAAATASVVSAATAFQIAGSVVRGNGVFRPILEVGGIVCGSISGFAGTSAGVRYALASSFVASSLVAPTGYRLSNSAATTFITGSYLRCVALY